MKYNIVFKFLAIALCALMLLGAAGSAAAIIGMTESGLYDISVEELRDRYIRSDGESMADRIAVDYAEANLGGVPEAIAGPTVYDLGPSGKPGWLYGVFNPALAGYVLKDAEGNVLESGGAEKLSDAEFIPSPSAALINTSCPSRKSRRQRLGRTRAPITPSRRAGHWFSVSASKRKTPVGAWTASNRSVISTTPATAFALRPIHRWA